MSAVPQMLAGNRLLLMEDEVLVAMALKNLLTEFDFKVVGPYNTVTEALAVVTALVEIAATGVAIVFIDGLDRVEVSNRGVVNDVLNATGQ